MSLGGTEKLEVNQEHEAQIICVFLFHKSHSGLGHVC